MNRTDKHTPLNHQSRQPQRAIANLRLALWLTLLTVGFYLAVILTRVEA